jgi:hypothetical protein
MRKGAKWAIALLFITVIAMVLYPVVAGWFVMM